MKRQTIRILLLGVVACAQDGGDTSRKPPGWNTEFAREMCENSPCRGPFTIHLVLEDGSVFERAFSQATPVVQEGSIVTIFPGEDIALSAEPSAGGSLRLAVDRESPDVTFVLSQGESQIGPSSMRLSVRSTVPGVLKFDLYLMYPGSQQTHYTSSCSVSAGSTNLELWHEPVFQIVAMNFRTLSGDSEHRICE